MERFLYCPECGRDVEHTILSNARQLRVRCDVCGNVHLVEPAKEKPPIRVKAIVSEERVSRTCAIELVHGEICGIGDRHIAECGEDYIGVEISAIDRGVQRVRRARAQDITTLWTRKIEEVLVRVSVHDGRKTIPLVLEVSGEEPFVVGEVYRQGNRRFRIAHMKLRDGATLRKEGQKAIARRLKRMYGYQL
ncbi:MAG TPA: HVO_0476 family zinc finger protein [Methanoregulaceae archaeon]|nr:MAG: zinc ribbon domain-containing protein [Methanolinea sp.]HON81919.1 HVO_0476 family zinc finger protein [Methanoregulaceae archaeon]HPD10683.1 HVO_0476 family zinc finger protein [Methanoregulaceae archaeon]HRT15812.1 HVO_0476 family zinc finger protein [Methanoregulaceae archaeon]HRU31326.1 HVO_0476 family zinc finger protein [Methanoregulaceae archaeon]